jgi:hypothetical protein
MDHGRHNGCLVHPTTSASGDKIDGPVADLTERAPVRCRSGALWLHEIKHDGPGHRPQGRRTSHAVRQ